MNKYMNLSVILSLLILSACGSHNDDSSSAPPPNHNEAPAPGSEVGNPDGSGASNGGTIDMNPPQKETALSSEEVENFKKIFSQINTVKLSRLIMVDPEDENSKTERDRLLKESSSKVKALVSDVKKKCKIENPTVVRSQTPEGEPKTGTALKVNKKSSISGAQCPISESDSSVMNWTYTEVNEAADTIKMVGDAQVLGESTISSQKYIQTLGLKSQKSALQAVIKTEEHPKERKSSTYQRTGGKIDYITSSGKSFPVHVDIQTLTVLGENKSRIDERIEIVSTIDSKTIKLVTLRTEENGKSTLEKTYINGNESNFSTDIFSNIAHQ